MDTSYKTQRGDGWYIGSSKENFSLCVCRISGYNQMVGRINGGFLPVERGYLIPTLDEIKTLFPGMPEVSDSVLFFHVFSESITFNSLLEIDAGVSGYIIGRKEDEEVTGEVRMIFNRFSEKNMNGPKIAVVDLGYDNLVDFMSLKYPGFGILG